MFSGGTRNGTLAWYNFYLDFQLPKRPGAGTKGRQITLKSNFYGVEKFPEKDIIHYNVTIRDEKNIDKTPKKLNRLIIEELVKLNRNIFKRRPVYDGKKNLYSIVEIPKSAVRINYTLIIFTIG